MKCSICNKSVNYFKQQKDEVDSILLEIKERIKQQIVVELTRTSNRYGFNEDNRKKVNDIKNEYLSMRIKLIVDNSDSFLRLEPNLEVLINYYRLKKNHEKIDTIGELKDSYMKEPTITSSAIANQLNVRIREIDNFVQDAKQVSFREIYLDYEALGLNNLPLRSIENEDKNKLDSVIMNRILLCPICDALFKKASNASYQAKLSENDWDDDDYELTKT